MDQSNENNSADADDEDVNERERGQQQVFDQPSSTCIEE